MQEKLSIPTYPQATTAGILEKFVTYQDRRSILSSNPIKLCPLVGTLCELKFKKVFSLRVNNNKQP